MFNWGRVASPANKYSLGMLKYLYNQLLDHPVLHSGNKAVVVEIVRTIAELMIWGDQHNDHFMW
jgi:protein CLEC16A